MYQIYVFIYAIYNHVRLYEHFMLHQISLHQSIAIHACKLPKESLRNVYTKWARSKKSLPRYAWRV